MKIKIFLSGLLAVVMIFGMLACQKPQKEKEKSLVNSSLEYPEIDLKTYTTYYFDSKTGNDANNGLTESTPKASVNQIEKIAASASADNPIRILFKKGSKFNGNVVLKDYSTSEEKPLILDSYGDGNDYPVFFGTGSDSNIVPVIAVLEDNIRIYNLEITGPTAYQGIYVTPTKKGAFKNIVIEGCYVHDVNFIWEYPTKPSETNPNEIDVEEVCTQYKDDNSKYGRYVYRRYAGISFNNDYVSGPTWFENVWIVKNHVENIGKIGINVYNMWDNQPGFGYGYNRYVGDSLEYNDPDKKLGRYPHKQIVCYDNTIICAGGDGLVLSGVEDGIIEKNVSYFANYLGRPGYWNGGIWVFGSRNVVMQYNEAAYTFLGGGDGQGFDIDNSCSNIYFQYNYSHHNEGGGILLCNKITSLNQYNPDGTSKGTLEAPGKWENIYIRNNLFVENGTDMKETKSAFITIARQTNYVYAYNNTIIMRDDIYGQSIIDTEDKNARSACNNHYYYNNIFYAKTEMGAKFTISMMYDYVFDNNLYMNIPSSVINAISDKNAVIGIDPQFTSVSDYNGWAAVEQLAPKNTQIFSLGKKFDVINLKYDISGNDSSGKNYVGTHCKS